MTAQTDREAFEAWAKSEGFPHCDSMDNRTYYSHKSWESWKAATQRQQSRIAELEDAARINSENYEFQRNKADKATATVYQFHYAMKDAGWHPGRTDDNLCDIIRAKGAELAKLEAEVLALRKDAEWLPIETAPEAPVILYFPAFGVSRGKLKPTLSPMIRIGCVSETPNRTPTHWKPLPPPPGIVGKEDNNDQ